MELKLHRLAVTSHVLELGKIRDSGVTRWEDAGGRECLIILYALASLLRGDCDEWFNFCSERSWVGDRKRPRLKESDRANALSFVLRFAIGAGASSSVQIKSAMKILRGPWLEKIPAANLYVILSGDRPAFTNFRVVPNEIAAAISEQRGEFTAVVKMTMGASKRGPRDVVFRSLEILEEESSPRLPL
ncbi:hypothetical protein [Rhizobium laguerreae]